MILNQFLMKVFLLDNYDSFTFNLFHYLEGFDCTVVVNRNDEIDWDQVDDSACIVLSPGPGLPRDSKGLMELIEKYHSKKPILGVCLGMQALGDFFGEKLYNLNEVKHGVSEVCVQTNTPHFLWKGVPKSFEVGLYHSWAVALEASRQFTPLAYSEQKVLMAFSHNQYPLYGVQFHPESILTPDGKRILQNFLSSF